MKVDIIREQEINALIPEAIRYANEQLGLREGESCSERKADKWNQCYHRRMTQLAVRAGIRIA